MCVKRLCLNASEQKYDLMLPNSLIVTKLLNITVDYFELRKQIIGLCIS